MPLMTRRPQAGHGPAILLMALFCAAWEPCGFAEKTPVYITASFVDKNGLFIENLDRSEVEILEDGNARKLEFIARDEIPVAYGILFERAMLPDSLDGGRIDPQYISNATAACSIAYELIDKLLGRHAILVADYDRELHISQDFVADGFTAKNAIQRLHSSRHEAESFLYAALFSAIEKIKERSEKRRVLIVFLETIDSDTTGKVRPLKNLLAASNVELFVVNFGPRLPSDRRGSTLPALSTGISRDLTVSTSGQAFFSIDFRDHLEDVVRRMFNHLRTYYTFGIEAESNIGAPGKLEIKCTRPGSKITHHPSVPLLR